MIVIVTAVIFVFCAIMGRDTSGTDNSGNSDTATEQVVESETAE